MSLPSDGEMVSYFLCFGIGEKHLCLSSGTSAIFSKHLSILYQFKMASDLVVELLVESSVESACSLESLTKHPNSKSKRLGQYKLRKVVIK